MIDIHTHILPGVDDGSKDLETSLNMIKEEIKQGVTDIVLTPHVQSSVTKATREEHLQVYQMLLEAVKENNLDIKLHLGAEIMYHSHLSPNYEDYKFGKDKYVLIEFSTRAETPIEDICYDVIYQGYKVIVAHVERYPYLSIEDILKIKQSSALIQTNASSILGLDKKVSKKTIKQLIKHDLIDIVATDTHSIHRRPPNLLEAKTYLKKYYQKEALEKLFNRIEL